MQQHEEAIELVSFLHMEQRLRVLDQRPFVKDWIYPLFYKVAGAEIAAAELMAMMLRAHGIFSLRTRHDANWKPFKMGATIRAMIKDDSRRAQRISRAYLLLLARTIDTRRTEIQLRDRMDMEDRLFMIERHVQLEQHFYPSLLEYAGTRVALMRAATIVLDGLAKLTETFPDPRARMLMYRWVSKNIGVALVDDVSAASRIGNVLHQIISNP